MNIIDENVVPQPQHGQPANDKKTIWAWTMYDWANSVFSLTIATAIFPIYFSQVCKAASIAQGTNEGDIYFLRVFGMKVIGAELYSFVVAAGFLLVALISPFLSGIADYRQNKKAFLKLFCYTGSLSCIAMYFFTSSTIELGVLCFMISLIGFAGSIVFYNAFLPEIVTEDRFDKVSARGFSMGYIGSVILLIINLVTIMMPQFFFPVDSKIQELMTADPTLGAEAARQAAIGHFTGIATRLSFVSVGLWWAGFAQITFKHVPEREAGAKTYTGSLIGKGFTELKKVWAQMQDQPRMKRYLVGFFFTSMGLQTVMYVASLFGEEELHLDTPVLIGTVLIIQLIAIAGAWAFSRISEKIGNIYSLIIMIIVWIIICGVAYSIKTQNEFMALGALVGVVMGGIQSLFRSTYAKLIPETTHDHASYFSFYDVCEKVAIVLGTFSYGLLNGITHNMRMSVLALAVYFVIGLLFIAGIKNFKTFRAQ